MCCPELVATSLGEVSRTGYNFSGSVCCLELVTPPWKRVIQNWLQPLCPSVLSKTGCLSCSVLEEQPPSLLWQAFILFRLKEQLVSGVYGLKRKGLRWRVKGRIKTHRRLGWKKHTTFWQEKPKRYAHFRRCWLRPTGKQWWYKGDEQVKWFSVKQGRKEVVPHVYDITAASVKASVCYSTCIRLFDLTHALCGVGFSYLCSFPPPPPPSTPSPARCSPACPHHTCRHGDADHSICA